MNWSRPLLALLALMALSVSSVGQESAAPEDEAIPTAPPPETPSPPAETPRLDELFIPSEEIGADEEVTFPVNI